MSLQPVTMLDTLVSARLTGMGLPALANVQQADTGVAPASDPYAAPAATVSELSGYGQLLSAGSRATDSIESLLGSATNRAASSAPTVVTATANTSAALGVHPVNVTQVAKAQTLESSAVFADSAATVFGPGSFSITQGSNSPATVTITDPSLSGLANSINAANAGVTASLVSGSYGYTLKIAANQTGAASAYSLSATPGDPFNQWNTYLSQLGLSQTQAGQDAAYTIDGVAGSSASNDNIPLGDNNASLNILQTGTSTVTISLNPTIPADSASITTAATKLVQDYNALQGTLAQLTAPLGALNGDATANSLSQDLYSNVSQATYTNVGSSLTTLAQLGITGTGQTSPLTINSTTLASAFASDSAGTASLLTTVANTLHDLISGYSGTNGSIIGQVTNVEQNMPFLNGLPAGDPSYSNVPNEFKQLLLQEALASAQTPPALPSISVFA
jgi:flagellar hook-associated protein 2